MAHICNAIIGGNSLHVMRMLLSTEWNTIPRNDMLTLIRYISRITALLQFSLLLLTMLTGTPGLYLEDKGFMYISDNFCTKDILAGLFMTATLPTWILLACSVSMETGPIKRIILLRCIAIPLPIGIGIVFFPICTTHTMHYVYVNLFVLTIAGVQFVVARTAKHFVFLQVYFVIVVGTTIAGVIFGVFAVIAPSNILSTWRNISVIAEYIAICGFIYCNSLCADRVEEHIRLH
jgi:hypothetical protein